MLKKILSMILWKNHLFEIKCIHNGFSFVFQDISFSKFSASPFACRWLLRTSRCGFFCIEIVLLMSPWYIVQGFYNSYLAWLVPVCVIENSGTFWNFFLLQTNEIAAYKYYLVLLNILYIKNIHKNPYIW